MNFFRKEESFPSSRIDLQSSLVVAEGVMLWGDALSEDSFVVFLSISVDGDSSPGISPSGSLASKESSLSVGILLSYFRFDLLIRELVFFPLS